MVGGDASAQLTLQEASEGQANPWKVDNYLDARQALSGVGLAPPDVLVLDVTTPTRSWINCVRKLTALRPDLRIIVLAARPDADGILLALMAGACGCLVKPVTSGHLLRAVRDATEARPVLCQEAQTVVMSCLRCAGKMMTSDLLTRREQEVVACVFQGLCNKEIAERLRVACDTVHVHLANLFRKLGVHDREEAIKKFLGAR